MKMLLSLIIETHEVFKHMKKLFAALFATLLAISLFGCQPSPESAVVVGKDNDKMVEQAVSTADNAPATMPQDGELTYAALCERYGAPERWQTSVTEAGGKMEISADVALSLPDTVNVPLARVTAGRFSQEFVYALFSYLCGDTPMYIDPEVRTKAQVQADIERTQEDLAKWSGTEGAAVSENYLKYLYEEYESAPEDVELVPSDGTLQPFAINNQTGASTGTCMRLNLISSFDADAKMFFVMNDADYENTDVNSYTDENGNIQVDLPSSGSTFLYSREKEKAGHRDGDAQLQDVTEQSLTGEAVDCKLTTTPAEARAVVEDFLSALGIDDMAIDTVSLMTTAQNYGMLRFTLPEEREAYKDRMAQALADAEEYYSFRLLRQLGDVTTESYYGWSASATGGDSFGRQWAYESFEILVDDEGILSIQWEGPLNVETVETESANLLPFSEIGEIFTRMMTIQNEPLAKTAWMNVLQIDVVTAKLCLWRIIDKNSFTEGLLVPAWCFYVSVYDETTNEETGELQKSFRGPTDVPELIINAVDGSVIDPMNGY